jgi:4-hydroxy-tetrahydrodipicolinate synthase
MTKAIEWLRGCATALITPFTAQGAIDEEGLMRLVERQIAGGVQMLIPCGITSESATITDEEHQRMLKLVIDETRGRAKIIAATGSNATVVSIERARAARDLGADAVLVVAPYYDQPAPDGLFAHFSAVAEAVGDLPVIISSVRGNPASGIDGPTALKLACRVENIVGIKDVTGDLKQIMKVTRARPKGFRLLAGDDLLALPLLLLGADGAVSIVSNEVPDLMVQMLTLALTEEWSEARALHYRLLPLMEASFIEPSPVPVMTALAIMGLIEEHFRLPLVRMHEKHRGYLRDVLVGLGLLDGGARMVA